MKWLFTSARAYLVFQRSSRIILKHRFSETALNAVFQYFLK